MSKAIKIGDILSAEAGLIIHGCNAQGVMGAGLAAQVKSKWPDCYATYRKFCKDFKNNREEMLGEIIPYAVPRTQIVIINAITQIDFGKGGKRYVSYKAIDAAFNTVAEIAARCGMIVHYPLIGAGLAGGDWAIISDIIETAFSKYPQVERTLWIYD